MMTPEQTQKAEMKRRIIYLGVVIVILLSGLWAISSLTGSNDGMGQRAGSVRAMTLKEGRAACASKEILEALAEAIQVNDQRAARTLMRRGCIRTPQGIPVSVLDATWTGIIKIRATIGAETAELWTLSESLQD